MSKSFVPRSDSIYFEQEIESSWKSGLYVFEINWELMQKAISFYVENTVIPETTVMPETTISSVPPEPLMMTSNIASFVDQTKDPQSYVNRYNDEPTYKEWFDENYSQYSSNYEAVGLEKPEFGICGDGTKLIDGVCTIIEKTIQKPWWQFW